MMCVCATLRPGKTDADVKRKREEWVRSGKAEQLRRLCVSATRYVIKNAKPPEVFWLLDTLDRRAAFLVRDHFSSLWNIDMHDVIPQSISAAAR